jgi:hypothetical protein
MMGEGGEMAVKDEQVLALASEIVALMRKHPLRHEAIDALDVARVLFRPSLGKTIHDQASPEQFLREAPEFAQVGG